MIVPDRLAAACRGVPERTAWLDQLPQALEELADRWSLSIGSPWADDASCSWVAPAVRKDGVRVVLKLGMPHMEGADEIEGLRFWEGDPTVRLLDADSRLNALLLERCEPGSSLRDLPEVEQDVVLAELLHRLWRMPTAPHRFRPLSEMIASWTDETLIEWKCYCSEDAKLRESALRFCVTRGSTVAIDLLGLATARRR